MHNSYCIRSFENAQNVYWVQINVKKVFVTSGLENKIVTSSSNVTKSLGAF